MTDDVIAICQHPDGDGLYVPAEQVRDGRCFQECDCTPRTYVAVDALLSEEAVEAAACQLGYAGHWSQDARAALRAAVEAITTTTRSEWCPQCGYANAGPVCTKCGRVNEPTTTKEACALRVLAENHLPMTEERVWHQARRDVTDTASYHSALRTLVQRGLAERQGVPGYYTWTATEAGRLAALDLAAPSSEGAQS